MFQKAVKTESKLRLAISGPSGAGKTYTALALATHLTDNKPIALVDTEHGSASKYADLFSFDVLNLDPPYHPDRYLEAIKEAAKAGYGVIILDSLSHAWNGTGGLLEIVDDIAKRNRNPNTFAAWKDATPIQNRFIDGLISANIHVIATMRSKQEYILQEADNGKKVPKKVGMAPVQRDGFEYEFDVFMEMDVDNTGVVTKSRCSALNGAVIRKPGKDTAETLKTWLSGAPAPEKPALMPRVESPDPAPKKTNGHTNGNGANGSPKPAWPKAWKDKLISAKYADNDFEAAGMLGKSHFITPTSELTPELIAGWGKYYRAERDNGGTPEHAADVADAKLKAHLQPA